MELSEVNWFSAGRSEGQHTHGHCSSALGCSFFHTVDFCLPEIGMMNSPTIKAPLLLFRQFSVFCGCTEAAFPRDPLLGSQEPSAEGNKQVPGPLGQPLGLVSRLQSRGFCTVEKAKMLFTFLNSYKQTKNQNTKKNM